MSLRSEEYLIAAREALGAAQGAARHGASSVGRGRGPAASRCCILLLYMAPARRTQIYLTAEQRAELDARASDEGASLAQLIREAVDEYLDSRPASLDEALSSSFGVVPDAEAAPRAEWEARGDLGARPAR